MNKQKNIYQALFFIIIIIAIGAVYLFFFQTKNRNLTSVGKPQQQKITAKDCISDDCLAVENLDYPVGKLPPETLKAVQSALDDEYKAYSLYNAVITKLGSTRPFSMIIRAEETHIASLKSILDKYGVPVPANPYLGKISAKNTLQENCQTGVDAEVSNVALYRDDLLEKSSEYPDITLVFTNLMNASQNNHLPAFERCN